MRQLNCLLVFCVLFLASGLAAGQCAPCTIWTPSSAPTIADSGDGAGVELGLKFRADSNGYVTGVRFYKSVANGGTHIGNLWSSAGVLLASAQFSGESASGWQQVNFSTPVLISSGTTYLASYFAPQGHYAFDANFFATSGVDNPPLHALASGVDGANGVYSYGATSSFPSSSYEATNYWVDVVYVPQGSTTSPTVTATAPPNATSGFSIVSSLSASFSTAMDPTTITSSSFQLFDPSNNLVAGTVSYAAATTSAMFQPSASVAFQTTYRAVVRGTVRDFLGNSMGSDFSWTFTTGNGPSNAVCPCTIWPSTWAPSLADGGDPSAGEFGVKFRADVNGFVTGIRFYKAATNTGTHIGNLWTVGGSLLGSVTFTGESASGWQQAIFGTPIAVTAGATYVASYFTSTGHYSWDEYYLTVSADNVPLHALSSSSSGGNGVYITSASSAFPNTTYNASSYGVDVVYLMQNSTTPPVILSTTPGSGATGVALGGAISVQFNEPMNPATITGSAFQLVDSSNNVVPGTVSYVSATASLAFQPSLSLMAQTVYTATVYNSVNDAFGNGLASNYTWSFTTAPPPADSGPGGPILVIASSVNPFSRYLGEILLNEGLNEFRVKDITTVTPTVLSQYDIAILGDFALTSAQASMLNTWVSNGGSLIAMRPDSQLAGLLGLAPTGGALSEGYMLVNTQATPGYGIYGQSMQFHGTADLYTLSGASSLATLYTDSTTPTTSPAVTLANAGVGQAAAFTYDLARSVVYLRQGNPAWSGQERDGYEDPAYNVFEIRSDDLYYGDASFDPEPDWVNLNNVQVPQADEQQRLLTNLIQLMNVGRKPLPRFWYLPSGFQAAVIMSGDDHGGNGTQPRFDTYVSESPANCSVADWTCVRATSYVFPANVTFSPPTSYTSYIAEGFEIANHSDNDPTCTTFTPASLDASITASLGRMTQYFPLAPMSKTNRTHCVLWSDYDSEPTILLNHGLRLDTTYYYWPDPWIQDRPGLFTGSGLPMRYADRNGNTIDVYQAPTQFPDETTWNFPTDINTVLGNAVGPQGFYAVFTANMHTDHIDEPESDQIVAAAQAYGVPVVASLQMLNWLDGRNNSTFSNLSWGAKVLNFTVTAASGAHNLEVMVPVTSASGPLTGIALGGVPVSYVLQTVKGLQYAAFLTTGGAYQASYGGTLYSLSGTISGAGGNAATVTLSGAATATTTASASGTYSFSGLANGAYTVTPTNSSFTFSPASQNATVNGANVTGVNFSSAAVTYSISGTISGAGGNAATVTLSGAATATTTANASGNYTFSGLANGAYTVTPSKTGYTFTPASQNVTVNGANVTAGNFSSAGVPVVQLSTTAINFGIVLDFTTSSTGSVTVRNTGTATLNISSITITGTNSSDFRISSNSCGATLAVNSTCTVGVRFTPQVAGARTAALTFTDSAANSPQNVSLSGTGTMVSVSPTSITFAARSVGTTSGASNVTIRNVGPGTLTISGITITGTNPGDFSQTNNCGSLTVNGSCTIAVVFKPAARGTRSATLNVNDSDPTSPELVTLTGTGR